MRIATYNVEWFNTLFDDNGQMTDDDEPSARYHVTRGAQIAALGQVFRALDADAVMVIEAPDTGHRRSTVRALETFAARFGLRARRALIGFANDTQQEIALLFDPDRMHAVHDPIDAPAPRFDRSARIAIESGGVKEAVTYNKPPLEVRLTLKAGPVIRLIGVHNKSKAPHGARNPDHALRLSIDNRRTQIAQCLWLRDRVRAHLAAGEALIVLGDFNDGPGLDEVEVLFGRSGVEIVLGWDEPPGLRLFDANARLALSRRIAAQPATARFYMADVRRYVSALIDFVMVSPDLRALVPHWHIWHPFDDPDCYSDAALREALLTASDHFPVSVDVNVGGLSPETPSAQDRLDIRDPGDPP